MTTQFKYFPEITPNLDGFTTLEEITAFQEECKQMEKAIRLLRSYAEAKHHAMYSRLDGSVETAKQFEKVADQVYAQLPDFAKW